MKKIVLLCAAAIVAFSANAQQNEFATWGVKAGVGCSNYHVGAAGLSAKIHLGAKTGFYVGAVNNLRLGEKFSLQTELSYNLAGSNLSIGKDLLSSVAKLGMGITGDEKLPFTPENVKAKITTHSLTLPIMAKFHVDGLGIMVGPYFSYRLASNVKLDGVKGIVSSVADLPAEFTDKINTLIDGGVKMGSKLFNKNISAFDFGAVLGVEYAFNNGIFIDARYNFSLLNLLNKDLDITAINDFIKSQPDYEPETLLPDEKINLEKKYGIEPKVKASSFQIGVGFRF